MLDIEILKADWSVKRCRAIAGEQAKLLAAAVRVRWLGGFLGVWWGCMGQLSRTTPVLGPRERLCRACEERIAGESVGRELQESL